MRIGISGHRGLTPGTEFAVDRALREHLTAHSGAALAGVSCLADGADQIFARAVRESGGQLEVIVPASLYRAGLPAAAQARFDVLIAEAASVDRLPFTESGALAYVAASRLMLDRIDALVAVWDGLPARGSGGTADVVSEARDRGIPVTVIWPAGASRIG
jgi:hypothetical protein